MIRRSTVRLPVAVLITVGAAIISIMTGRADAAVLAAPWAVLLALGLTRANRPTVVGSVTTGSDRVLAGDPVEVVTRISGADGWVRAGFRPATGFWPTRIGESGDGHGSFVAAGTGSSDSTNAADVADVARPDRPTELRATLTAEAWGSHDVGRVEIEVHEPYGLLRWSGSLHTPSSLRVHPRPIDIQQLLTPFFVRRLTGAHRSRSVGRGVEYADIRHYTFGDSVRDINWRASARSQDLLVSERHPDRSTDVVLLLDSFAESGHDMRSILGLAIEAAIGLAESHLSVTDRVGLIEVGGILRWVNPGTGQHQLHRLTDTLLATRLYENAADRQLAVLPPRALPPRSFVVALSPLLDQRFVDSLFLLRARGHDVSVIECPPLTEPGAEQALKDRGDSSRLAFLLWQAERAVTRDQLGRRGIPVGQWRLGDHLDQVLAELTNRRQRSRSVIRP